MIDNFCRDTTKSFRDVVATWDDCEVYLPKLDKLIENIGEIGRMHYTRNAEGNGFNVLNHADLHLRNILIKANDKQRIQNFYLVMTL